MPRKKWAPEELELPRSPEVKPDPAGKQSAGYVRSSTQTRETHVFSPVAGSRYPRRLLSPALYFAAFGCLIFAVGDVHASPLRAGIAVLAAAALWLCGEAAA